MINKLRYFTFLLLVFSCISQLGKHFWPQFAYISGIRIDYLAPTVYLSDLLIGCLLLLSLPYFFRPTLTKGKSLAFLLPKLFFISLGFLSILISPEPLAALYGLLKVLEYTFLGWFIIRFFSVTWIKGFMFTLLCGVGVESLLVMIQMFNQESVGGLWYFLGERTFSAHTIGISTIYVRGQEILRAYGSFPHPNVLAFYLFFSLVYIFTLRKMVKSKWIFLGIFGVGIIGVTSLFLTFSRSIIILSVVLVGLGLLRLHAREKIIGLGLLIGVVSVILKVFSERFAYGGVFSEDISYRIEMLQMGGKIIKQHPIFGVGIQNYLYVQFPFYDRLSPIFLQPIHSIYMLVGMQVGIVGIIGVSLFVFLTGRSYHMLQQSATSQYIYNFILASRILSLSVLIVGLFDHYFLTLQQGQIVTTLLISFGWLPWKDPRDLV